MVGKASEGPGEGRSHRLPPAVTPSTIPMFWNALLTPGHAGATPHPGCQRLDREMHRPLCAPAMTRAGGSQAEGPHSLGFVVGGKDGAQSCVPAQGWCGGASPRQGGTCPEL